MKTSVPRVALAGWLATLLWLVAAPAQASTGAFERAWGDGVGGPGVNLCVAAAYCTFGASSAAAGGFDTATGVAAVVGGDVYVVDTDEQRVQKFDSAGNFVFALGADVGGPGVDFCDVPAQCSNGTNGVKGGQFNQPTDVAIGTGGNFYVTDSGNTRIQEFTDAGSFVLAVGKDVEGVGTTACPAAVDCTAGTSGSAEGAFNLPSGIGTDESGNVYVADTGNQRVQKFDSSLMTFLLTWGRDVGGPEVDSCTSGCGAGSTGNLGGQFSPPMSVVADPSGGVYVSDAGNNRIQRFDSAGGFLRAWGRGVEPGKPGAFGVCTVAADCQAGTAGALGGEMSGPRGVALGAGGDLYVADIFNERLQKFVIAAPALTAVSPKSPANQNVATVNGSVEPATTVNVFDNASCSGAALGTGGDATLSSTGIDVTVPDDSTTTFFANTTDELGQVSACSTTSLTYVEDSTAPDTLLDSAPSGTISTAIPTTTFHATEPNATFMCRFDAQAFAPCSGPGGTNIPLFPLADGAHTFDVFATDQAGNVDLSPARATFGVNTAVQPTELPPPVRGRLVNAIPEKGTVLVKLPAGASKAHAAAAGFVPLETIGRQLPVGSTLDTTRGRVLLTAATNTSGGTQDGHFNGGLFVLGQGRKNALTTLSMTGGGLRSCGRVPRGGSPKPSAARAKRRRLFSDARGRFRTRGRNSVATVRGTRWTMTDSCKGTLTIVKRGTVVVRDLVKRRSVTLTQGQRYLARLRKR